MLSNHRFRSPPAGSGLTLPKPVFFHLPSPADFVRLKELQPSLSDGFRYKGYINYVLCEDSLLVSN